jgi:hypothetical protein
MKHSILVASVMLVACGGGEPTHEGTINSTGARTSVESVREVFAAMDSSDGASAADAVMALTAAGQIVVTPGQAREQRGLLPPTWTHAKGVSNVTGSATCTATGCVFDNYGDDSEYGSFHINGSIQRTGDRLAFDLDYDILYDGLEFHWHMDGDVVANDTLIDGDVHSDGTARFMNEGETYNLGWSFDIGYEAIHLDPSGCPISGALTATVAYASQGQSYRAAGSIGFGPACGQYTLH